MKKGKPHTEETKAKISASTKDNAGRPTKYSLNFDELVFKLCLLGATDEQLVDVMGISVSTFYEWKKEYKTFSESIEKGKLLADAEIANALYNRAKGYTVKDVKVFQFQGSEVVVPYNRVIDPDTSAASLWLRNRQPKKWRDKIDVTGGLNDDGSDKPIQTEVTIKHLSTELLERINDEFNQ